MRRTVQPTPSLLEQEARRRLAERRSPGRPGRLPEDHPQERAARARLRERHSVDEDLVAAEIEAIVNAEKLPEHLREVLAGAEVRAVHQPSRTPRHVA